MRTQFSTKAVRLLGVVLLSFGLASAAIASSEVTFTSKQDGVRMFEVIETPLSKKFEEIKAPWKVEVSNGKSRLFVFEKAGFIPVYLPVFQAPANDTEIHVSLKKLDGETRAQVTAPTMAIADQLVDEIISAQHLLDQKQYSAGLVKAEQLYSSHPMSVAVRLVYANALVMNKQVGKADSIYASIQEELPENKQSILATIKQVRNRLRGGSVGINSERAPASTESKGANE